MATRENFFKTDFHKPLNLLSMLTSRFEIQLCSADSSPTRFFVRFFKTWELLSSKERMVKIFWAYCCCFLISVVQRISAVLMTPEHFKQRISAFLKTPGRPNDVNSVFQLFGRQTAYFSSLDAKIINTDSVRLLSKKKYIRRFF